MLFACCDDSLAASDRLALTLKMLCGLSHREIAAALLSQEETIRKRIYRARELLKTEGFFPGELMGKEVLTRIDSVLEVLYLMFNEGYKAQLDTSYFRFELCEEAAFSLSRRGGHRLAPRCRSLFRRHGLDFASVLARLLRNSNAWHSTAPT